MGRNIKDCTSTVTVETMTLDWVQIENKIRFKWGVVTDATHYKLSKAWMINTVWNYRWDDTITSLEYYDMDFIYDHDYFCSVKAYKNNELIGESPKRTVRYYEYFGIEDDEYWEAIEEDDNQKPSLFNGCSMKRDK